MPFDRERDRLRPGLHLKRLRRSSKPKTPNAGSPAASPPPPPPLPWQSCRALGAAVEKRNRRCPTLGRMLRAGVHMTPPPPPCSFLMFCSKTVKTLKLNTLLSQGFFGFIQAFAWGSNLPAHVPSVSGSGFPPIRMRLSKGSYMVPSYGPLKGAPLQTLCKLRAHTSEPF